MNDKTKWEGLWYRREGVYSGKTIKKSDIPPYSKLIIRYNKYYEKDTTKPRFVYCFANGDSANAITLEVENETFISMVEMQNKIEELEEQIENMFTYEQVRRAIHMANEDGVNGYTDIMVEDYIYVRR